MTTTKNNEHKNIKVPNLRFPEFQGEWEKCKLGDIANITGGYAFKSDTLNSIGGKYQVVKMGNLYQNQLDLHRSPSYTNILTSKAENVILRKGDIAITLTGTNNKRDFGYTYIFCFGIHITNTEVAFPPYLSYYVSLTAFRKFIYPYAQGSTRFNLCKADFEKACIKLPTLENQKRIYSVLGHIDCKIETERQMLNLYIFQKQYMLRQMFT